MRWGSIFRQRSGHGNVDLAQQHRGHHPMEPDNIVIFPTRPAA